MDPQPSRILRLPRRRALGLSGALALLGLVAAACGGGEGGGGGGDGTAVQTDPGVDAAAVAEAAPSSDFMSTRPGAGITAAGGNPQAIRGDNPCDQPGSAEPIFISYVGANLSELDAIGLEAIIVEEPGLIIEAYVNEINFNGGINGRCVEFVNHLWSLTDPVASFTQICTDLVTQRPVVHLTLTIIDATLECATIGAQLPTVGLYAPTPESTFVRTRRWLFIDDGSVERILTRGLAVARAAGVIDQNDLIGLLQGSGASAGMGPMMSEAIIDRAGLNHAVTADIPSEYGDLALLLSEKQVRLLESGLSEEEQAEAQRNLDSLDPAQAAVFAEIERFYTQEAERFRDADVTAVLVASNWSDMRRMMRAAEKIDWVPIWLATDIQPATLTIRDVPDRQARNLVQTSSRRAAGDPVPPLDQGCVTLRNTAVEADPFAHRPHTDAWNLMTAVCDYLDVAFSALTRAEEPITPDSFVRAMNETHYEAEYGGLITFTAGSRSGAEHFRVLEADPDCVLDSWGCMRSITDWLTPADLATAGAG